MILMIILFIFVIVLLWSWYSFMKQSSKISVTGPMPLPLIGNAHLFLTGPSKFLNVLHDLKLKYGDAYLVYLLNNRYVMISHPKYVEPLVSSTELILKGRAYNFIKPWLGEGLITATGYRWKTHRKFLTPAFHFDILQSFLPVFCKNSEIYTKKLRGLADGNPVDIFPITTLVALDNVTESIMGVSMDAQTNSDSEYVKAIEELTRIIALKIEVPIIGEDFFFNLSPYKHKQDKALRILHKKTEEVIEARRQELQKCNINLINNDEIGSIKNKNAFLDLLLLTEVNGERIDDESIRREVDTFMFAGHDTTTSAISFSLFCISKNADVQDKIYKEQKNIFGDDMERHPTYAELHEMKYLDMVLKECLRLYPAVPFIERLISKDVELGSLKISAGTLVIINIMEMHRNPDVFDDPLTFKPERFELSARKNPFSWLPFSAGPRNCIGQRFAMMEIKVLISSIIRKLKLLPADIEPALCAELVLRSNNGVYVRLEPRN